MSSTGIFWIREDFRIENNPALSFATQNHDNVIALYIYNNNDFDNKREAQKWWVFKSLETLKKELSDYKINLEIVKGDELEICLLYTSPSPRDVSTSRMPSSA